MSDLFDKQHLEELEDLLFTEMSVKTKTYNKLLLICESLETIPVSFFEKFVEDCYQHFKKEEEKNQFPLSQLKMMNRHKFLKEGGDL